MNTLQDRIRGSLIGGAIGDALGYPVEFIYSFEGIQGRYGERGITRLDTKQFWLDDEEQSGKAVVESCVLHQFLFMQLLITVWIS